MRDANEIVREALLTSRVFPLTSRIDPSQNLKIPRYQPPTRGLGGLLSDIYEHSFEPDRFKPASEQQIQGITPAAELGPQGGLVSQLTQVARDLDPREPANWLNIAGVFAGPRQPSHIGSGPKGFGHPEKEFPSVVPGWTIKRVPRTAIDKSTGGVYGHEPRGQLVTEGRSGLMDYHGDPPANRSDPHLNVHNAPMGRAQRYGQSNENRPGVPVAYNWVNDETGEIGASIELEVKAPQGEFPGETYTNWIGTRPQHADKPFLLDVEKLMKGLGNPVDAAIMNERFAYGMGRMGRYDPMYAEFARKYGHMPRPTSQSRRTRGGGDDLYHDRLEPDEDPNSPFLADQPTPPIPAARARSILDDQGLITVARRIEARLDRDGHAEAVDRMHDDNIHSTQDRILVYLSFMRARGYPGRTIEWYGSRARRYNQPLNTTGTPSWPSAMSQIGQFLRNDGYHREVNSINRSFPLGTGARAYRDRVTNYLELMHSIGYSPETLSELGRLTPEPPRTLGGSE